MSKPTTAPAPVTLWIADGGEVTCGAHGGATLAAHIAKRPKARSHSTVRGLFTAVTVAEVAAWPAAEVGPLTCETCHAPALT